MVLGFWSLFLCESLRKSIIIDVLPSLVLTPSSMNMKQTKEGRSGTTSLQNRNLGAFIIDSHFILSQSSFASLASWWSVQNRNLDLTTLSSDDYVKIRNRRPYICCSFWFKNVSEHLGEPHLQHLQSCLHAFVDSRPPTKLKEFHIHKQFHYIIRNRFLCGLHGKTTSCEWTVGLGKAFRKLLS